jgi:peptidoglycan/LPS O-acetylase OafA/YrhL
MNVINKNSMVINNQILESYDVHILKSVAIVTVILYHIANPAFPGGFIGVDIFLVVTGYLSASSLDKNSSIKNFILGRISRIYPSLQLMLIVTFIFTIFFGFGSEIVNAAKYYISSTVLATNVHLLLDKGYFSASIRENPYYHLWSISVEFQLWVIISILYTIKEKNLAIIIAGVLSIFFGVYYLFFSQINWFYLLPLTRFWEVALGILAYNLKRQFFYNKSFFYIWFMVPVFGIASLFDLNNLQFIWISCPLFAALILIFGLTKAPSDALNLIFRFLSRRTYGLYLWHIPAYFFVHHVFGLDGEIMYFSVLALTILSAEISYKYYENTK